MVTVTTSAPAYRLVRSTVAARSVPTLDPSQQAVVDHPGGPLLVLAGPGTGKTTTLVEAVVERVRRGTSPDRVLVLTFSRKAADELRERIATRLGRTVSEPAASTFHAWCYATVRAHRPPGEPVRLLSQPERDVRIRELLAGHAEGLGVVDWPASLRPALRTRGFAREVAALFDRSRERGLDGRGLRQLGRATDRPAWVAGGQFLDEFLDVLEQRGETDYAGLVMATTAILDDAGAARAARDRYDAVFVDEYQDTDPSQERLLQVLAGGGRDLVVVGDPDQSIYAFRGADVGGILGFADRFHTRTGAPADVLTLGVSRRTGEPLLGVSRRVAERLPTPGLPVARRTAHRALTSGARPSLPVEVRLHPSVGDEVAGIADLLRRAHLQDGLPWSRMAVLVRSGTRSLPVMRRALVSAGVPLTTAADDVPVFRDPAVSPLLLALRVCGDPDGLASMGDDEARLLLTSPLGRARPTQLRVLGRQLRALHRAAGDPVPPPSTALVREALVDGRDLVAVDDWVAGPVRRLRDVLVKVHGGLRHPCDRMTPEAALWLLWDGSGWSRRLSAAAAGTGATARRADRDLDAVVALFEAAARLEEREPRAAVATLLDELELQDIPAAPLEERSAAPDAVRLMTAHRSKGLEWDLVVVAGLQDEVWPDLRRRTSLLEADLVDAAGVRPPVTAQQLLADERRLFYVALTRARRRLVVTAVSAMDDLGDRPSRFLDDVVDDLPPVSLAGTGLLSPDSLVARLRRAAQGDETSPALRRAAAGRIAALAAATDSAGAALLPAADPASWWGMSDWSPGVRAVRDPEQPLALSGSAVAGYDGCPLRWFLEHEVHAGSASSAAQGFGMVVHALAKLVADGVLPADADVLSEQLGSVWDSLGFEAKWQAARERDEATTALRRLVAWLAGRPDRRAVAAERRFDVSVGDVRITGAADRLEVDLDGRVHVVDFKTSRSEPSQADAQQHPQLAVYQLAAREGGFRDEVGDAPALGGAELVLLRIEKKGGLPSVRGQDPLPPERPGWADDLLAGVAAGVRAEQFPARVGERCGSCAFQAVCPAQDAGEQVVS
jgi:superfamily I DNA/RNA helicase/RecB family exonuclease